MADALDAECRAFCRYLAHRTPPSSVIEKYRAAHTAGVVEPPGGSSAFDRGVVSLARRSTLLTRALDARARILAPGSLLRRKLVLVLALLECTAETVDDVDAVTHTSRAGLFAHLVVLGLGFVLLFVAGIVVSPLAYLAGGGDA